MIIVDKNKCPQDHRCPSILICPTSAISQEGLSLPIIDHDLCILCQKCVEFCPTGAMQLSSNGAT